MGYDRAAFELAHARMTAAPWALTAQDIDQLKSVSPDLVTVAQQLREFRHPLPAASELVTKNIELPQEHSTGEQRTGITQAGLEVLIKSIARALKPKFQEYQARIATLEQSNAALSDRILELEAQRAAREVPVDRR